MRKCLSTEGMQTHTQKPVVVYFFGGWSNLDIINLHTLCKQIVPLQIGGFSL